MKVSCTMLTYPRLLPAHNQVRMMLQAHRARTEPSEHSSAKLLCTEDLQTLTALLLTFAIAQRASELACQTSPETAPLTHAPLCRDLTPSCSVSDAYGLLLNSACR